jgi:AcrR family transcriptional regulator
MHHQDSARDRLCKAAIEVFAQKGFNRASTREICQNAGVNGAAINYYFGDKISLYREVTRPPAYLTEVPEELTDPKTGLREGLISFFRPFVRTLSDWSITPHLHMLFVREQIQPSGLLGEECNNGFRPRYEKMREFLCRHCGTDEPDDNINHLTLSLSGMAMMLFMKRDIVEAYAPSLLDNEAAVEATLQRLTDQAMTLVQAEAARRHNNNA